MNWLYKDKEVTSISDILAYFPDYKLPTDLYGFVYIITYPNDRYYIGKKNFFNIKTNLTKINKVPRPNHIRFFKKIKDHHKIEYEQYKVETNWQTYIGSNEVSVNADPLKKEILEIAPTKRVLTYLEAKYLFQNDVLRNVKFINANILGTFFKETLFNRDEEIKELNHAKDPILWPMVSKK